MKKSLLLSLAAVTIASSAAAFTFNSSIEDRMKESPILTQKVGEEATLFNRGEMQRNVPMQRAAAATEADESIVFSDSFENINETTYLPEGWTVIDKTTTAGFTMQCGLMENLYAADGDYYLVSGYDLEAGRNAWAISPKVTLTAGVTYYVSIYAWLPEYQVPTSWRVTVGNAATEAAQTTTIIDMTGENAIVTENWGFVEQTFTPATTGDYYFAINHCTPTAGGNSAAFDLFSVKTSETILPPVGSLFSTGGLWSIEQWMADENGNALLPTVYLAPGTTQLDYYFYAENYTSHSWYFDGYVANDPDLTSATPSVVYDLVEDSIYSDAFLMLENKGVENAVSRGFNIKNLYSPKNYSDVVGNIKPEDFVNALQTTEYDFLFGLNADFTTMAEYYEVPEGMKVDLHGFYFFGLYYNLSSLNRLKNMTVNVYLPDANGLPGEVVYSEDLRISDAFGAQSYAGQVVLHGGPFANGPVQLTGSFFIGIEFPAITASENNYLGLFTSGVRYGEDNTMYFYNTNVREQLPEGWYAIDDVYRGAQVSSTLYALLQYNTSGVNATKADDGSVVYANGNQLVVLGVAAGSQVVVTDLAGRTVLVDEVENGVNTTIDTNLNKGIYIVTVNGNATKVAIR